MGVMQLVWLAGAAGRSGAAPVLAAAVWVGFAALVTVIVNLLKHFKVIPDGWAGFGALIGDLLIIVVGAIAGYFEYDLMELDQIAGLVAQLLVLILASFATHKLGRAMELPLFRERRVAAKRLY